MRTPVTYAGDETQPRLLSRLLFSSLRLNVLFDNCSGDITNGANKIAWCPSARKFFQPLKLNNHCIENRIGVIVFGWNKGQKREVNLGAKTNQKFVQIPTAKVKDRIAQLCEQQGIEFIETEESYTSKASFVDSDQLPTIGEKPDGWKDSGKRVKRGLYRTAINWYINADCNEAANILPKVSTTFGFNLDCLGAL